MEIDNFIASYYIIFGLLLIGVVTLTPCLALIIFRRKEAISRLCGDFSVFQSKCLYASGAAMMSLLVSLIIFLFVLLCLDLKYVRAKDFPTLTGTVVGYARASSVADGGKTVYAMPIFQIADTDEKMTFYFLGGTQLHGKYTVMYLKHSRAAVIVDVGEE